MQFDDSSDPEEQHEATWEHQSLARVKIRVLRGHKDAVNSCSFAFNDSKIVSASHDKTLRLWDTSTGAHLKVYKGHSSFVTCCHTDPNSTRIASGGWDKRLIVWDIQTGTMLITRVQLHAADLVQHKIAFVQLQWTGQLKSQTC